MTKILVVLLLCVTAAAWVDVCWCLGGDAVESAKDGVAAAATSLKGKADEAMKDAHDTASDWLHTAQEKAKEFGSEINLHAEKKAVDTMNWEDASKTSFYTSQKAQASGEVAAGKLDGAKDFVDKAKDMDMDMAKDAASGAMSQVKDKAGEAKDAASGAMSQAKDKAGEAKDAASKAKAAGKKGSKGKKDAKKAIKEGKSKIKDAYKTSTKKGGEGMKKGSKEAKNAKKAAEGAMSKGKDKAAKKAEQGMEKASKEAKDAKDAVAGAVSQGKDKAEGAKDTMTDQAKKTFEAAKDQTTKVAGDMGLKG